MTSTHEHEFRKAIRELREQGVKIETVTPQDQTYLVNCEFILTTRQMVYLRRQGKLNLLGITELDSLIREQKKPSNYVPS